MVNGCPKQEIVSMRLAHIKSELGILKLKLRNNNKATEWSSISRMLREINDTLVNYRENNG